jgi:inner membrane protein
VACALAPDIDVVCSRFGIAYTDLLGHRGITHSFLFAAVLSGLVVLVAFRKPLVGIGRPAIFALLFLATVSHSVLDAMVEGTLGVAFFAPFSSERYFLPWRPIVSSPIGWGFFSSAGATVILNEFVWIWLPSLLVIFAPRLRKYIITRRGERRVDSSDAVADLAADLSAGSATD